MERADLEKTFSKKPKLIGEFIVDGHEFFSYHYMPIKLAGRTDIVFEKRLNCFRGLIGAACCDFVGNFDLDRFVENHVYLTAKRSYQRGGQHFNRAGWHSDGFGTDDISYIWSDKQPTIFNESKFNLSNDEEKSMEEMREQAQSRYDYSFPNNSLVRMDQFSIHRVGDPIEGVRTFLKICISPDIYALKGNSINPELEYSWEYKPRQKQRNVPQA